MKFTFRTAGQIRFGLGESAHSAGEAARLGKRVLLVTGASSLQRSGVLSRLSADLERAGLSAVAWKVTQEPDVALVDEGARLAREGHCDVVLAVGGGSVLDAAKAVAALATNEGSVLDYLEDVPGGGGRAVGRAPLPLICVPTTAGTGSEVTRNAVIRVPQFGVKRSMRDDRMVPRVAIVDPGLIATAPLPVIAAAAFDALTHLMEAYLTRNPQPTTDALAVAGMRRSLAALRDLSGGQATVATWESLALASLWGGMALANAGLGAVHGLVAPLGGLRPVPHGVGCARLLPETMVVNARALRERAPESAALTRLGEVVEIIGGGSLACSTELLVSLRRKLGVPTLTSYGVEPADFPAMVAAARGASMRGNPIELTDAELLEILAAALATA